MHEKEQVRCELKKKKDERRCEARPSRYKKTKKRKRRAKGEADEWTEEVKNYQANIFMLEAEQDMAGIEQQAEAKGLENA